MREFHGASVHNYNISYVVVASGNVVCVQIQFLRQLLHVIVLFMIISIIKVQNFQHSPLILSTLVKSNRWNTKQEHSPLTLLNGSKNSILSKQKKSRSHCLALIVMKMHDTCNVPYVLNSWHSEPTQTQTLCIYQFTNKKKIPKCI